MQPTEIYPILLWNFTLKGSWEWIIQEGTTTTYSAEYEFVYKNVDLSWSFNNNAVDPARFVEEDHIDELNLAFGTSITYKQGVHMSNGKTVWNTYVLDNAQKFYTFMPYHKYEYNVFMHNFHVDPVYLANVTKTA